MKCYKVKCYKTTAYFDKCTFINIFHLIELIYTLVFLPFRQNRLLVPFACLHPAVRRHVALPNLRHLEFLTRDLYVFTRELLLLVVIAIYIHYIHIILYNIFFLHLFSFQTPKINKKRYKVNSRNFAYDGPTFSIESAIVKDALYCFCYAYTALQSAFEM